MLLKAYDVTEIVIDGVTYTAENGLIDAPISPHEAILFGLDAPTPEEVAALRKGSDNTSGDNTGSGTENGQNANTDSEDAGGKNSGGKGGKSGGKSKDDGDGAA